MNFEISIFPNLILIIISLGISFFTYYILKFNTDKKLKKYFTLYLIYNIIIFILAHFGFFANEEFPPRMILIFIPLIIAIIYLARLKKEKVDMLEGIEFYLLILFQSFRIIMEFILVMFYNDGVIPHQLTLHGRNFDIVIGILSIPIAFTLYKKHKYSILFGKIFNILGLIALVNIITIAIPSAPSPFRNSELYSMNYFPTYFPGILVIYIVPMAIFYHILSLKQLTLFKNHFKSNI